ncbi:MAG: hypothetical protein ACPLZG_11410 [Thermoproteota archaeon]
MKQLAQTKSLQNILEEELEKLKKKLSMAMSLRLSGYQTTTQKYPGKLKNEVIFIYEEDLEKHWKL